MVNLASLQTLQSFAFVNGLRGTYDLCELVISSVLDTDENVDNFEFSNKLFSLACKNHTSAWEEFFKLYPEYYPRIQVMAISAIKTLINETCNYDEKYPIVNMTRYTMIKEISELL